MELLKQYIQKKAEVIDDQTLKVDMFLNHQIDPKLLVSIGQEFYNRFQNENITKVLTIEASGIGIACASAQFFSVPALFAKKSESVTLCDDMYQTSVYSFTKKKQYNILVSKEFLCKDDRVLIVDDFLANGQALKGLLQITELAGATVVGAGIVIEKGFQQGGKDIRQLGINVQSLSIIESLENGTIVFSEQ